MKNQKNLDELYRERLLNKEVAPPVDAWSNIADRLPQKKKKNFVPLLWYRIAGVAAIFIAIGTLASRLTEFSSSEISTPSNTVASEALPNFREIEKNAFESFSRHMISNAELLEEIIRENKTVKNDILERSSSTAKTEISEAVVLQSTSASNVAVQAAITSTEKNLQSILKIISEDKTISEEFVSSNFEEENEVEEVQSTNGRLSLSTKIGPLFNGNKASTNAETSMSYGLSIAYAVSDKLSIRSGINKMNLNSAGPEVTYTGGVQSADIEGSRDVALASPIVEKTAQNIGFIELPLEMQYTLIDKKLRLHLIGGSSVLFLNNDAIQNSSFPARSFEQNPMLDKTGYTGNLGVGFGYHFFRELELSLEPMIKFRIGDSQNSLLNPYFFGVYSGLSYRF